MQLDSIYKFGKSVFSVIKFGEWCGFKLLILLRFFILPAVRLDVICKNSTALHTCNGCQLNQM